MTDGEAILRAILENPADDTARLVCADWLEENRKSRRAGFIRAQIATGRSAEFVGGHDCLGWHPATHECGDKATFAVRRGFVAEVRLPLAAFLAHAEALFRAHPVERVVLTDREPRDLGYGWCWYNGPGDVAPDYLPIPIWRDNGGDPDCTRWVRAFPEDCRRALGLRCVAHGRELAGLPPLPAEAAAWA